MLTLLSEIHFWSTQEDVLIKQTDYGSFKYYSKRDNTDSLCFQSKKKYCESRGVIWNPVNKRPQKLRDKLKELEDYLLHNKIVCFNWTDNQLQLLLSTGVLVNLIINIKTGDINSITFEKQLSAKLQVNILCDGIIFGQQIICICNDGHVLGYGGQWKEAWIVEGGPRRHLNFHNDWLAVWGKAEAEHPQPWSPLGKDYQRANLHLYWVGVRGPELLAYKKTDGDPIDVIVSRVSPRTLLVIEQKVTLRGSVSVEVNEFELISNNLKRKSVTSVPLQTQVSCCALSHKEDRLLIGCIDGSLALLDRNRGSTRTIKALFIPKFAKWHPNGAVVVILNERGQLQYFDTALNTIKSQMLGEDCTPTALIDLSGYFNSQFTISAISWGPKDLILALEQGPIALLSHVDGALTFKSIAQRYLKMTKIEKAITLLLSWEFNEESFSILQKIVGALLSKPMTEETAKFLQDALGAYHSPAVPISSEIRNRFSSQVYSLTRRFFHQLVRASMFETAFLLAVDLGHHDLFMDLHYIAVQIGETEMAAAARAQASALLSRCSSEASNCSRSSCSQCSSSGSSEESEEISGAAASAVLKTNESELLTTNFNQALPKTYRTGANVPPIPSVAQAPRATFVRAPQVPASFQSKTNTALAPPPLPFAPPLPNLCLGIPYPSNPVVNNNNNVYRPQMKTTIYNKSNFTAICRAPPLPTTNVISATNVQNLSGGPSAYNSNNNLGAVKKQQAKVKFSDTVTAFIVPEIKRPIRPPPPPHLTDPQKELADSLPLCHPNEDYLKDFTPIRKSEGANTEAGAASGNQPKIKVVHFGVV